MRDDMPCAQFRESLADQLDDVLSPALAEHLAACDDCRDFRHDARVAARALREAGADYVPMDEAVLVGRLMAALDARETKPGLAPAPSVAMATYRVRPDRLQPEKRGNTRKGPIELGPSDAAVSDGPKRVGFSAERGSSPTQAALARFERPGKPGRHSTNGRQNGFTMTKRTIPIMRSVGASFWKRKKRWEWRR